MSGFTKLFSSIVTSSIWIQDDATVRVWVAMLATADAGGVVEGSVPGFANLARVTVEQMRAAVVTLSSPDADSRTPDHDGRRIEVIQGGWRILNYRAYRERGQGQDRSRAPYHREYRLRQKVVAQQEAQHGNVARNTEAEAEAEERSPQPPKGLSPADDRDEHAERGAPRPEAPATSPWSGGALDSLHVDDALSELAAAFLDRYQAVYQRARHGAFYRLAPARDHAYACDVMRAWPDLEYAAKMAELFLLKDDWKSKNQPGTVGQFLHMAPSCDALLRQHGMARRTA